MPEIHPQCPVSRIQVLVMDTLKHCSRFVITRLAHNATTFREKPVKPHVDLLGLIWLWVKTLYSWIKIAGIYGCENPTNIDFIIGFDTHPYYPRHLQKNLAITEAVIQVCRLKGETSAAV